MKNVTRHNADLCDQLDPDLETLATDIDTILGSANDLKAVRTKQLADSKRLDEAVSKVKDQLAEVNEAVEKVESDRVHTCREKIETLQVSYDLKTPLQLSIFL